jgi:hypothetical protein
MKTNRDNPNRDRGVAQLPADELLKTGIDRVPDPVEVEWGRAGINSAKVPPPKR